jgi:hypothetical protein
MYAVEMSTDSMIYVQATLKFCISNLEVVMLVLLMGGT